MVTTDLDFEIAKRYHPENARQSEPSLKILSLITFLAMSGMVSTANAEEKISPLPSHLPLATEACFGRTYDFAHLSKNPKQRVTSFHILRDFSPDPTTESEPSTPAELRENDGQDGNVNISAYVRFRDRKGLFWNSLSCRKSDAGVIRCGIDCDGGGFKLRASNSSLLVENEGFVVVGGCGASEDEQERTEYVKPGTDDKTFRLDPQPIAMCAALRDQERPTWAKLGEPLRVRFARESSFCFSRTYDDAHLAKNGKQNVRAISIVKAETPGDAEPPGYRMTFRLTLRSGQKVETTANCWPDSYAYTCNARIGDSGDGAEFSLTRAGETHMMLRDRRGALAKIFPGKLGTDDRTFRLQSAADCAP
jgi:hypothetical protein